MEYKETTLHGKAENKKLQNRLYVTRDGDDTIINLKNVLHLAEKNKEIKPIAFPGWHC